jgi:hypothetical protein
MQLSVSFVLRPLGAVTKANMCGMYGKDEQVASCIPSSFISFFI